MMILEKDSKEVTEERMSQTKGAEGRPALFVSPGGRQRLWVPSSPTFGGVVGSVGGKEPVLCHSFVCHKQDCHDVF